MFATASPRPSLVATQALTAPRVDPSAPSAEIDSAVRAQLANGGPVYHVFNGDLKALKPDVVITQDQCRVCAVTRRDLDAALKGGPVVKVVVVQPVVLDDVFRDVRDVAGPRRNMASRRRRCRGGAVAATWIVRRCRDGSVA